MSGAASKLNSIVVRAGAGAGKTTRLVEQVFTVAKEYSRREGRPPRLLVTTFTKKATQELRERLVKEACEKYPEFLEFVSSASLLHISTIHGMLVLFLRRYGHLAGIDSGFKIMDAVAAANMRKKTFKDFLFQRPEVARLLDVFNVEELIDIVSRVDDFVREKPSATTYDADELRAHVRDYLRRLYQRSADIFARIAAETEKDNWREYARNCAGHFEECRRAVAPPAEAYSEWTQKYERPRFNKNAFSAELKAEFDEWKKLFERQGDNPALDPANQEAAAEILQHLAALREAGAKVLRERKMAAGLFEMKDLELLTLEITNAEPSLGRAFARDWDYSLIDEFQDTSPLQVEILRRLLGGVPQYVVGDPQQSIYLFRGARSEVFGQTEAAIVEAGGERQFLTRNYRSRPELLSFINDLSEQLGPDFSAMEPREPVRDEKATVAVFAPVLDKEDRFLPIADFILREGGRFDDFAVLARRNSDLIEIAHYLESIGIPTHVHAAGGFSDQREVLDVLAILRFLCNPHDYENLITLFRSPWFKVDDSTLSRWAQAMAARDWTQLCAVAGEHSVILKLQKLLVDSVSLGLFETLRQTLMQFGLIDFSHFHDATGRRESNIWKLMMSLRKAERMPNFNGNAFIQHVLGGEGGEDEDSEAVAALEPNRVNLMTVHKAKGLKFRKVIIPNMQQEPRTQARRAHEKPVVCDEAREKWSVRLPIGPDDKRDHLIPARLVLEDFSQRELAESRRLLYVAVTRAVDTCFFTWHGNPEKNSWASLLKFDLTDGAHQQANYVYEVRRGPWNIPAARDSMTSESAVRPPWREPAGGAVRSRISVSGLLELVAAEAGEKGAPFAALVDREELERSLRLPSQGTRIHSLLEKLRYRPDLAATDEVLKYVADLTTPPMRELLRTGEVEWGFQVKTARGVLEGQIDLWGIADHHLWVVDYKSGSERYKEQAFRQLELYAYALSRGGHSLPIKLAVIYPLARKVVIRDCREPALIAKEFKL